MINEEMSDHTIILVRDCTITIAIVKFIVTVVADIAPSAEQEK